MALALVARLTHPVKGQGPCKSAPAGRGKTGMIWTTGTKSSGFAPLAYP